MEIPAWVETIFEKVVVVFEMPASDTLKAAGSPDLLPWLDSLLAELPLLVQNAKAHVFPTGFLTNVLGVRPETAAKLPLLLTLFIIFYLLCGGATVALRYLKKQTSLLSFSRQTCNAFVIWACMLLVPMRKVLLEAGSQSVYPKLALVGILLAWLLPLASAARYLWVYRLNGIPHAIFDAGFGLFALSVLLLSVKSGKILFLLVILAMAALTYVQWAWEDDEEPAPRQTPPGGDLPQRSAPAADSRSAPPARKSAEPVRKAAEPVRAAAEPVRKTAEPAPGSSEPVRKTTEPAPKAAASVQNMIDGLKPKLAAALLFLRQRWEILLTEIRMLIVGIQRSYRRKKGISPARKNPSAPPAQSPASRPAPEPAAEPDLSTQTLDIDAILAGERHTSD